MYWWGTLGTRHVPLAVHSCQLPGIRAEMPLAAQLAPSAEAPLARLCRCPGPRAEDHPQRGTCEKDETPGTCSPYSDICRRCPRMSCQSSPLRPRDYKLQKGGTPVPGPPNGFYSRPGKTWAQWDLPQDKAAGRSPIRSAALTHGPATQITGISGVKRPSTPPGSQPDFGRAD
jgi:hypothetical protein